MKTQDMMVVVAMSATRTASLSLRVSPELKKQLKAEARLARLSLSDFIVLTLTERMLKK